MRAFQILLIFTDFESTDYSTSNSPDPSVSLYPVIGRLVYIMNSTPEYVSGTFRFIAFTADGLIYVGFNEGVFYRVPITGGSHQAILVNKPRLVHQSL